LEALGERLTISRAQLRTLHWIRAGYQLLRDMPPGTPRSQIVEWLEPMDAVCWLALWATAQTAPLRQTITDFVEHWRHIHSSYDGNRLKALGVPPSPVMGHILRTLRHAWIDGKITSTQAEDQFLKNLLNDSDLSLWP
jgi:hypothetical protein